MWSLSLVMSECSLSGRGQRHVINFYIVDLENFATASRRYTVDIHNSTVVCLFDTYKTMKATRMRHGWVHMFITHRPTLTLQLYNFDLFRTWQDFNWHDASLGPSAIGELLVKIVEHLAQWLIASYTPFALDVCPQRCRTRQSSKITCM